MHEFEIQQVIGLIPVQEEDPLPCSAEVSATHPTLVSPYCVYLDEVVGSLAVQPPNADPNHPHSLKNIIIAAHAEGEKEAAKVRARLVSMSEAQLQEGSLAVSHREGRAAIMISSSCSIAASLSCFSQGVSQFLKRQFQLDELIEYLTDVVDHEWKTIRSLRDLFLKHLHTFLSNAHGKDMLSTCWKRFAQRRDMKIFFDHRWGRKLEIMCTKMAAEVSCGG